MKCGSRNSGRVVRWAGSKFRIISYQWLISYVCEGNHIPCLRAPDNLSGDAKPEPTGFLRGSVVMTVAKIILTHLCRLVITAYQTTPELDGLEQPFIIPRDSTDSRAPILSRLWSAVVGWAPLRLQAGHRRVCGAARLRAGLGWCAPAL